MGFTVFADGDPGLRFIVLDRILLWGRLVLILVLISLPLPEFLGLFGEVLLLGFGSSCHDAQLSVQFLNGFVFALTLELEFFILL